MGEKLNLDIIFVNYNSTDCLLASIESLYRYKPEAYHLNIIVVDNASTDNALGINNRFLDVHLIVNPRNLGFGAAINQALTYCHSRYIILLNPDSLVFDGFLTTCIDYLETHPDTGAVGPKILNEDESIQGSARSFPTPMTSLFGRNSPIAKIFPKNSITKANILTIGSDGKTPMGVDWISGACMVVRRKTIEHIGGFDERFFLYWEDTDLCRRIKDAGWEVIYLPGAKVIHIGGKSSNSRPIFSNFHFHKSCYRLYDKYAVSPYSVLTPIAGMALMLRFLIAVVFNILGSALARLPARTTVSPDGRKKRRGEIKILRIISRMNIGGPSVHVKNLMENLNPKKFVSQLIFGSISPTEGDMNYIFAPTDCSRLYIPELQREVSPLNDMVSLLKIIMVINKFKPDIVDSHLSKAGTLARTSVFASNLFRKNKIKTVHTFHGNVFEGYFNPIKSLIFRLLEKWLALNTNKIIAISTTQKWELSQKYKIAPVSKIETIGLGFNLFPFVSKKQFKGRFRQKLGVDEDTVLIGIVGRLVPIKNHKMFIDAAKMLLDHYNSRKVIFVLVGGGEIEADLKAYSTKIGVSDHIIFYGWEKNIPMVYADLNILALTSLNEGTPVSVIEAMAASVPVVSTGVGGIKDLLGPIQSEKAFEQGFHQCERGILCPNNDPSSFAGALHYMLSSNYMNEKHRFDNACRFVLKDYSMERLVSDMESLYSSILIST